MLECPWPRPTPAKQTSSEQVSKGRDMEGNGSQVKPRKDAGGCKAASGVHAFSRPHQATHKSLANDRQLASPMPIHPETRRTPDPPRRWPLRSAPVTRAAHRPRAGCISGQTRHRHTHLKESRRGWVECHHLQRIEGQVATKKREETHAQRPNVDLSATAYVARGGCPSR